jgi:peptide/nickel transport system substrate-binding protein
MIPVATITEMPTVTPGLPVEIPISVTFEGQPYKIADIQYVKYIITSPTTTLVGVAEPVKDGEWRIKLKSEETSLLPPGVMSVEVIVVSKLVGMPVSATGTAKVMSVTEYLLSELAKVRAEYEAKISDLMKTVGSLGKTVDALTAKIDSLTATVNTLMGVTVVAIIIAVVAIALPFVKRK